ncbi:leucyl aminopeptidase [Faunimonas pinastri]|uniref:Probable cytosol aminopeptidase n=1 Tax=Faunimonas pinastri TaxID=1855383 RepID=A0A1H9CZV5_9HYPH|nr:leucyl aminopeptidase [Faunimonas pinastri]SEQ06681.1 leucyl aminopeptidase [Faunimonas pinastri]
MAVLPDVKFVKLGGAATGSLAVLTNGNLALANSASGLQAGLAERVKRAAVASKFTGNALKTLQLLAPGDGGIDRLVAIGIGEPSAAKPVEWLKLGGVIAGTFSTGDLTLVLERPDGEAITAEQAAEVALGFAMRAYSFDLYKTKKKDEDETSGARTVTIALADPDAAGAAWTVSAEMARSVYLARDLVNEPSNILGPVEFADRLAALSEVGLQVEVLDENALAKEKMGALLGVAQGSVRPARVVVMRWNGGASGEKPVAFVGKGVVFDTGGISIKPAAGMEDMKGDMGGAAAVSGVMRALAARKAKVNAVGIVGLVENMPDGNAQRPGDIVTSRSGQTIEVINTDAEGRLVLADILDYIQDVVQPVAIVDLATLTGAIIVALGNFYAGMFSNDDALSEDLARAGRITGEKLWRLPIGPEYDKLIDSKFADMKNVGPRWGGSIAAAEFLHRFIKNETPWAHLDIAGTAMGSPADEVNTSWASGFGVRLLDQYVRDRFEKQG